MHRGEPLLAVEQQLRDRVGQIVGHVGGDHQEVRHADRLRRADAAVLARLDLGLLVGLAEALAQRVEVGVERQQPDVLGRRQVGDRPGGDAAGPEERVDRAVAQRLHGLADPEPALADVLLRVEPGDLQQPQRDHLGARVGRADGDRLALQVLDPLDPRVGLDRDLRDVRVDRRERAQVERLVEARVALDGVDRGVRQGEADVGVVLGDQDQVVDRCRGGLRRRRRVGQLVGHQVGQPAAEHLVHAARATGRDRVAVLPAGRVVRGARQPGGDQECRPDGGRPLPPAHAGRVPRGAPPETGQRGCGVEPAALLVVLQRRGELVELALEQLVEVVRRVLDAVVGDAPLGEVVGADLLGPLAGPDLGGARGGQLGLLLGELGLVEARAQHLHRALAVLELRLLVLHRDHDAGRLVRDPDRRVGRVDRLAAGPRGAVDVDLEVRLVDLDVDVLGLGQHRDRRGRGVDAALGLRLGDPLHAVRAALELEHGVGAVTAHLERVGAVGRAQRLGLEAAPLGVAGEHAIEVAGPQTGLVAARAAADLDDHVLLVGRVALDHREPDLLLELGAARPRRLEHLAQLGILAVLGQQLLRARGVVLGAAPLLGQPRGRRELVVQPPRLGVAQPVADHRGVRELRLGLGVARLDLLHERLASSASEHRRGGRPGGRPPRCMIRAAATRAGGRPADVDALAAVDEHLAPAPDPPPACCR